MCATSVMLCVYLEIERVDNHQKLCTCLWSKEDQGANDKDKKCRENPAHNDWVEIEIGLHRIVSFLTGELLFGTEVDTIHEGREPCRRRDWRRQP